MNHPRRLRAEPALVTDAELGEGPAWDTGRKRLLWVDIPRSTVHLFDPATGADERVVLDRHVGAVVPDPDGFLVAAVRDGFARVTPEGDLTVIAAVVPDGIRMNDGKVAPDGSFWAGTMAYDAAPGRSSLYRLDPDGTVTTLLGDLTISNGLDWDPEEHAFWFVDTPTQRVDRFDVADDGSGSLSNRRPFVELPAGVGKPDGLTRDDEGGLWVALAFGWAVHRYLPDGTLDTVVEVDAAQVTSCCFGGGDGGDLFITTARAGADPENPGLAGSVFHCRPGVTGPPARPFGTAALPAGGLR